MKIYNIVLDEEGLGLDCVSIVDDPAIQKSFLKFNKKEFVFFNEEQRIVTGPAIITDVPIFRRDYEMGEYFVVFTEEITKQLVERFMKNKRQNFINLEHSTQPNEDSAVMVESFFISHERGICPKEFQDLNDGSWIVSYKILNDKLWNSIKNGNTFNGFSIEVSCNLKERDWLDEYL